MSLTCTMDTWGTCSTPGHQHTTGDTVNNGMHDPAPPAPRTPDDPRFTEEYDRTTRTVRIAVDNITELHEYGSIGQRRRMRPTSIELEWRDGVLRWARIGGRRVLVSGQESLTDGATYLMPSERRLLPGWAVGLVERYRASVDVDNDE